MFRQPSLFQPSCLRNLDHGHSPLAMAINDTSEMRSRLFPERRRIPARKGKLLIALGFVFHAWGMAHLVEIRRQFNRKEKELAKLQRKSLPFFQAMADIRYCATEDKKNMLISELFAHRGEEYTKKITKIYHQDDVWVPYRPRAPHQYTRAIKDPYPYFEIPGTRFLHGFDVYNI